VEKRLEIRASSGAALTAALGNERRGRSHSLQSACATGSRPGLPGTDLSSARRFHQVTSTALRRRRGASRAKRVVFGRKRGAERTTSASLLADDVPGTQPTTTSVVGGTARDDVGGRFGGSEHHHLEARIFAPSRTSVRLMRCLHRPRSERVLGRPTLRSRSARAAASVAAQFAPCCHLFGGGRFAASASVDAAERAKEHLGAPEPAGPDFTSNLGTSEEIGV
jgi:hypothetical protein